MYNYRVKGLKHRREKDEAVAAYFSHIGDLYQAHHLWCEYSSNCCVQECVAFAALTLAGCRQAEYAAVEEPATEFLPVHFVEDVLNVE